MRGDDNHRAPPQYPDPVLTQAVGPTFELSEGPRLGPLEGRAACTGSSFRGMSWFSVSRL